ncbi:MAG: serine/threonine-protein kinase [Solirubrobacteraceae bacterium]
MTLKAGSRLDSYEVTSLLSAAGVGAVYRARHVVTGDEVALKLLPRELAADDAQRLRFIREARNARALVHPAIVRVRDVGETKEGLYIAMEYVAGRDLGRFLAQHGPLPPPRVVSMLTPVAKALDAAHAAGIIHRDVKPSNILVASGDGNHADGACLVTDFGFSIAPSRDIRRLTQAGTFVGSAAYAAPEQVTGETVDDRVDVYALGCVVCECLTGEPPFPRERLADVMAAHVSEQPPEISKRVHGLPLALDPVIAKALAKDPAARYPTCLALIEAVGRALRKPIAPVVPAPAPAPAPAPRRANQRALVRLDVDWHGSKAALRVDSGGDSLRFYWDGGRWVERQR